jgi:hypothetical protein
MEPTPGSGNRGRAIPNLQGLPELSKMTSTSEATRLNADAIDPARVPQRILSTGATMPAIGLGTFGSDHVSHQAVADAVTFASQVGYRHFDCASVYGNEDRIGLALKKLFQGGLKREEVWITSSFGTTSMRRKMSSRPARSPSATFNSITWTCTWFTGRFRITILPGAM